MNFVKSKPFLAAIGCIGALRFILFVSQTLLNTSGFDPYTQLEQLIYILGDSSLGSIFTTFLCALIIIILALLGLVLPSIVLFILAFGKQKFASPIKLKFIALLANSILISLYYFAYADTLIRSFAGLLFFAVPMWGWFVGSFWGFGDAFFLFLTTIIQLGLLTSVIISKFENKAGSMSNEQSKQSNSVTQSANFIQGNGKQNMNQKASTWTVRIPGQPENPIDTATLQNWAKSGFLKADTMVTEVATGYSYQARQIPGVFSSKSFITALLLSFFFGVFGVDRFYLGHIGVGLGKLFTFGGLGIWALIDFILIATKTVKDSQGIPLA